MAWQLLEQDFYNRTVVVACLGAGDDLHFTCHVDAKNPGQPTQSWDIPVACNPPGDDDTPRCITPTATRCSSQRDDGADALDDVVAVAVVVPRGLGRLRVALGVGRAAAEDVLAGLRVPLVPPALPGERGGGRLELRVGPGLAAVGAHLDAHDRRRGPTTRGPRARIGPASTKRVRDRKSGMPGGTISARGRIRVTGVPGSSSRLAQAVARRLLPAAERLVDRRDRAQPLDVRHPVPARHDQPQREAVLRRQRLRR